MPVYESQITTNSEAFAKNRADHLELINGFRSLEQKISDHSARALPKFRKRGQLLSARAAEFGVGSRSTVSPAIDLVRLSDARRRRRQDHIGWRKHFRHRLYFGVVRCMIGASESGIRGGAMTPAGVDKGLRMQDIAMENKLPYVQLIESAGANLFRQSELFIKGGRSFANLAKLSARGLPVIGVTHGSSTAGGAYQSGLCDYLVVGAWTFKDFPGGSTIAESGDG